ncbi:MAG: hypothetical protein R6V06_03035 [Kiritimatiellia bacterium]
MTKHELSEAVMKFIEEVRELNDTSDSDVVQQTRDRLERQSYSPILILSVPGYLSFSKEDVVSEIERVAALSDEEMMDAGFEENSDFTDLKSKHITLLVYHFKQLVRLRKDEPEAWDAIDELFGDD